MRKLFAFLALLAVWFVAPLQAIAEDANWDFTSNSNPKAVSFHARNVDFVGDGGSWTGGDNDSFSDLAMTWNSSAKQWVSPAFTPKENWIHLYFTLQKSDGTWGTQRREGNQNGKDSPEFPNYVSPDVDYGSKYMTYWGLETTKKYVVKMYQGDGSQADIKIEEYTEGGDTPGTSHTVKMHSEAFGWGYQEFTDKGNNTYEYTFPNSFDGGAKAFKIAIDGEGGGKFWGLKDTDFGGQAFSKPGETKTLTHSDGDNPTIDIQSKHPATITVVLPAGFDGTQAITAYLTYDGYTDPSSKYSGYTVSLVGPGVKANDNSWDFGKTLMSWNAAKDGFYAEKVEFLGPNNGFKVAYKEQANDENAHWCTVAESGATTLVKGTATTLGHEGGNGNDLYAPAEGVYDVLVSFNTDGKPVITLSEPTIEVENPLGFTVRIQASLNGGGWNVVGEDEGKFTYIGENTFVKILDMPLNGEFILQKTDIDSYTNVVSFHMPNGSETDRTVASGHEYTFKEGGQNAIVNTGWGSPVKLTAVWHPADEEGNDKGYAYFSLIPEYTYGGIVFSPAEERILASTAHVILTPSGITGEWWYQVDGGEKVTVTGSAAHGMTIGDANASSMQTVTITYGVGDNTATKTYTLSPNMEAMVPHLWGPLWVFGADDKTASTDDADYAVKAAPFEWNAEIGMWELKFNIKAASNLRLMSHGNLPEDASNYDKTQVDGLLQTYQPVDGVYFGKDNYPSWSPWWGNQPLTYYTEAKGGVYIGAGSFRILVSKDLSQVLYEYYDVYAPYVMASPAPGDYESTGMNVTLTLKNGATGRVAVLDHERDLKTFEPLEWTQGAHMDKNGNVYHVYEFDPVYKNRTITLNNLTAADKFFQLCWQAESEDGTKKVGHRDAVDDYHSFNYTLVYKPKEGVEARTVYVQGVGVDNENPGNATDLSHPMVLNPVTGYYTLTFPEGITDGNITFYSPELNFWFDPNNTPAYTEAGNTLKPGSYAGCKDGTAVSIDSKGKPATLVVRLHEDFTGANAHEAVVGVIYDVEGADPDVIIVPAPRGANGLEDYCASDVMIFSVNSKSFNYRYNNGQYQRLDSKDVNGTPAGYEFHVCNTTESTIQRPISWEVFTEVDYLSQEGKTPAKTGANAWNLPAMNLVVKDKDNNEVATKTVLPGKTATVTLNPANTVDWWYRIVTNGVRGEKVSMASGKSVEITIGDETFNGTGDQTIVVEWNQCHTSNIASSRSQTIYLREMNSDYPTYVYLFGNKVNGKEWDTENGNMRAMQVPYGDHVRYTFSNVNVGYGAGQSNSYFFFGSTTGTWAEVKAGINYCATNDNTGATVSTYESYLKGESSNAETSMSGNNNWNLAPGKYTMILDTKEGKLWVLNEIPVTPKEVEENGGDWTVLEENPAVYIMAEYLNFNRVVPDWQMARTAAGKYVMKDATLRGLRGNGVDGSGDGKTARFKVRAYYSPYEYVERMITDDEVPEGLEANEKLNVGRVYDINVEIDNASKTITSVKSTKTSNVPPFFSFVGGAYIQSKTFVGPNRREDSASEIENTDKGWQESWLLYGPDGHLTLDRDGEVIYSSQWPPKNEIFFNAKKGDEVTEITSSNLVFTRDGSDHGGRGVYLTKAEWREVLDASEEGAPYWNLFNNVEGSTGVEADEEGVRYARYVINNAWLLGETKIWTGWNTGRVNNSEGTPVAQWNYHGNWGHDKVGDALAVIEKGVTYKMANDGNNFNVAKPTFFSTIELYLPVVGNETDGFQVDPRALVNGDNPAKLTRLYTTQVYADASIEARITDAVADGKKVDNKGRYLPKYDASVVPSGDEIISATIERYIYNSNAASADPAAWDKAEVNGSNHVFTFTTTAANVPGKDGDLSKTVGDLDGNNTWFYDGAELTNGRYFYAMTIEYKDAASGLNKTVTVKSNPFTILNANFAPRMDVVQIIEIHEDMATADLGEEYEDLKVFAGKYLTYRATSELDNAYNYYTIEPSTGVATIIDKELSTRLRKFLKDNPVHFYWTSDVYVSGFTATNYRSMIQQGITDGSYAADNELQPVVYVKKITKDQYVRLNSTNGNDAAAAHAELEWTDADLTVAGVGGLYPIGRVVNEHGYMGETYYAATLAFRITDTNGDVISESTAGDRVAAVAHTPVAPLPHTLTYYYQGSPRRNMHFDDELTDVYTGRKYIEVATRGARYGEADLSDPDRNNTTLRFYQTTPGMNEGDGYDMRNFNAVFNFFRPNVSAEIRNNYDIYYTVSIKSELNDGVVAPEGVTPATRLEGTYVDRKSQAQLHKEYEFVIENVSPNDYVHPSFRIERVVYVPKDGVEHVEGSSWDIEEGAMTTAIDGTYAYGEFNTDPGDSAFGDNYLYVPAVSVKDIPAPEIGKIYLAKKDLGNGKATWYYRGHDHITQGNSTISSDVNNPNRNPNANAVRTELPWLYHVEAYAGGDDVISAPYYYSVPWLVAHLPDHFDESTWTANDGSTQTGTPAGYDWETGKATDGKSWTLSADTNDNLLYEAVIKNIPTDIKNVNLVVTPVHVFYRDVNPVASESSDLIEEALPAFVGQRLAAKAVARAEGEEETAENKLMVVRGESAVLDSTNNKIGTTGIENVMYGYDENDGSVEYYNVQGMRIMEPQKGQIYIVRRGTTVTKEYFK